MHVMYTCRQLALTIKPNEEPALLKLHHDPLHNRLVIPLVYGNKMSMYDGLGQHRVRLRNVTRSKSDARARTRHHNVERVQVLDRFVLPIRQLQQRP